MLAPTTDLGGLTLPRIFVGRRNELRDCAARCANTRRSIVRGIGGSGQDHADRQTAATPRRRTRWRPLVIRCHELSQPVDALNKIASFWQAQGKANHAEAAALLLASNLDPADRARQALQLLAARRYVIVFDNLESWFDRRSRRIRQRSRSSNR